MQNSPPPNSQYQLPEDKFYTDRGATPPERVANASEDAVMEAINGMSSRRHGQWTQIGLGGYIECHACPDVHGHSVQLNDMLIGTDAEGNPMLEKLVLS